MKILASIPLVFAFLFNSTLLWSQSGTENSSPCKAPPSHPQGMQQLVATSHLHQSFGGVLYIPLSIHVLGTDSGTGYYSKSDILEAVCELNANFEPYDFYFYIEGDFNYIDASYFYNMPSSIDTTSLLDQFVIEHNVENTVNVYIPNTTSDFGGPSFMHWPLHDTLDIEVPWVTNFPQDHAVFVRQAHLTNNQNLFTHEMGHYFSLWHTFFGWEGLGHSSYGGDTPDTIFVEWEWQDSLWNFNILVERVDGLNCDGSGDFICDTPPDYLSYWYPCNDDGYSLEQETDPTGLLFQTDGSYYMSYSSDLCQDQFSPQQVDIMRYYAEVTRSYLLYDQTPPDPLTDPDLELIFPTNDEIVAGGQITLEWEMTDALYYDIKYGVMIDGFFFQLGSSYGLEEASFPIEVVADKDYYWIVTAVSDQYHYYPCHSFSDTSYFSVNEPTSAKELEVDQNVQLLPNPFSDEVQLLSEYHGEWAITIYNAHGQLMKEYSVQNGESIELIELSSGLYFLSCFNGEKHFTRRMIKI